MATYNYGGLFDHSADAAYVTWRDLFFAALINQIGLVQTADTGQYTPGAGVRPTTNTAGHNIILRTADSSLYYKIETGTGSSGTIIQCWFTAGTGSNGSGTLTGQTSTRNTIGASLVATSIVTNYTTYLAAGNDFLTIVLGQNSTNTSAVPMAGVNVQKLVDSAGAATTEGFGVLRQVTFTTLAMQTVRLTATAKTYNDTGLWTIVPGLPTVSEPAGSNQAWHAWMNMPQMRPSVGAVVYILSELAENNTFVESPVGAVSHTYLTVGSLGGIIATGLTNTVYGYAWRYE